jgi:hypothetical protein
MVQDKERPDDFTPAEKPPRRSLFEWSEIALLAALTLLVLYAWSRAAWQIGLTVLGWIW